MGKWRRVGPRVVGICQCAKQEANTRAATRGASILDSKLSLEEDLVARISAGELQAMGFEGGSDAGPTLIPQRYFWKTEEIDWDKETVTAIGKKFYYVTVQGEREPEDEWTAATEPVDLALIQARFNSTDETPPSQSRSSDDRSDQSLEQAEVGRLTAEPEKPRMGRPSVLPVVRRVIRELVDRNSFSRLSKKQIEAQVRDEAQKSFPDLFRSSGQPAKNTINKALKLEGWPRR